VGWALRALSATRETRVPWHRVVGAGGRISLRAGPGPWLQRRLLQAEGVPFRAGRVDLKRAVPASQARRGSRSRSRARRTASRRTA
jgi:alkylated DNA nucleotide flippase Atl1